MPLLDLIGWGVLPFFSCLSHVLESDSLQVGRVLVYEWFFGKFKTSQHVLMWVGGVKYLTIFVFFNQNDLISKKIKN